MCWSRNRWRRAVAHPTYGRWDSWLISWLHMALLQPCLYPLLVSGLNEGFWEAKAPGSPPCGQDMCLCLSLIELCTFKWISWNETLPFGLQIVIFTAPSVWCSVFLLQTWWWWRQSMTCTAGNLAAWWRGNGWCAASWPVSTACSTCSAGPRSEAPVSLLVPLISPLPSCGCTCVVRQTHTHKHLLNRLCSVLHWIVVLPTSGGQSFTIRSVSGQQSSGMKRSV